MTEQEAAFIAKKKSLLKDCYYGFKHFCDGTPNLSITSKNIKRPPCPDRHYCELCQTKIFKTLEEENNND